VFAQKVETGGRGALHHHDLVTQPVLQPRTLERLLDVSRNAMFRFLERLMCGYLPRGWKTAADSRGSYAVPPDGFPLQMPPRRLPAAALKPNFGLDRTDPIRPLVMDMSRACLAAGNQTHVHTDRCKKGGHAGTDMDCGVDGVRLRHERTSYENGLLRVRLDEPTLVFHMRPVTLALRCNNVTYCFAEQSKFALSLAKYQAVAGSTSSPSKAPQPPTIMEASFDGASYTSKYVAKHDHEPRSAVVMARATNACEVRPGPSGLLGARRWGCLPGMYRCLVLLPLISRLCPQRHTSA